MPLYEYVCNDCGTQFEKMVHFSDANRKQPCPTCDSEDTKKRFSTFATSGSGFSRYGGGSSGGSCGSSGGFS